MLNKENILLYGLMGDSLPVTHGHLSYAMQSCAQKCLSPTVENFKYLWIL
jgi:hypothetical protein